MKVVFRPAARRELLEGAQWYEARVPGLGLAFVQAVKAKTEHIAQSPLLFKEVHHGTRRAVVGRFPYTLFFRITSQRIVILAVFHSSRKPIIWRRGRT